MANIRSAIYYFDSKVQKEAAREWLESLRDRSVQSRIYVRIQRAEMGNFGDHKSVGDGVMELRMTFGSGYRLYYALDGNDIILLLMCGDKSTQSKDIETAKKHWKNHQEE